MITTAPPIQLLSARLPATPDQLWARVRHSAFVADYLGATLPPVEWQAGQSLHGTGPDGAPLAVTVIAALAPCSLSLRVSSGQQHLGLQLSIAACADGSRLTLRHEAVSTAGHDAGPGATADAVPGAVAGTARGAGLGACAGTERGTIPATEHGLGFDFGELARRLAAPPGVALSASALGSPQALAAAWAYLADTATLVAALVAAMRSTMLPHQAYALPADGRFSLAQHVWHLADVEQFGWARRFDRLLAAHNPRLPGIDGDRLAIERRYQQRRWQPAAARFVRQRQHTLAALARCTPATLQRPVHFSGQATTGGEMLAALLAHDHEHRLDLSGRLLDHGASARTAPSTSP